MFCTLATSGPYSTVIWQVRKVLDGLQCLQSPTKPSRQSCLPSMGVVKIVGMFSECGYGTRWHSERMLYCVNQSRVGIWVDMSFLMNSIGMWIMIACLLHKSAPNVGQIPFTLILCWHLFPLMILISSSSMTLNICQPSIFICHWWLYWLSLLYETPVSSNICQTYNS
jgi:hypothetical protein